MLTGGGFIANFYYISKLLMESMVADEFFLINA